MNRPVTRIVVLAAPTFMLAYGLARLIDGRDGDHGPGPAWTSGHLFLLASLLLFGAVLVVLRGQVPRYRPVATAAVLAGLAGLLAFARLTVVDLVVGVQAADRDGMSRLFDRYGNFPGLPGGLVPILDAAGPAVFYVSLLVLTVLLAAAHRLPWWSPALVGAGSIAIPVDLDLLPVGSGLVLLGLLPLVRGPKHSRAPERPARASA